MLQNTQALKPTVLQRLSFRQLQTLNENPPKVMRAVQLHLRLLNDVYFFFSFLDSQGPELPEVKKA